MKITYTKKSPRWIDPSLNNGKITLTFDTDSGLLQIEGKGIFWKAPIKSVAMDSDIKGVEIKDGITIIDECTFGALESLSFVSLPETITHIRHLAFFDCISLTSITLPKFVSVIEHEAFFLCEKLQTVTCCAVVPPTISDDTFLGTQIQDGILRVPKESVKSYKTDPLWGLWGTILPIED